MMLYMDGDTDARLVQSTAGEGISIDLDSSAHQKGLQTWTEICATHAAHLPVVCVASLILKNGM